MTTEREKRPSGQRKLTDRNVPNVEEDVEGHRPWRGSPTRSAPTPDTDEVEDVEGHRPWRGSPTRSAPTPDTDEAEDVEGHRPYSYGFPY